MVITYRRTGGLFMLLTVAVAALAATVITVAVAGILLIVAASCCGGCTHWACRPAPAVATSHDPSGGTLAPGDHRWDGGERHKLLPDTQPPSLGRRH